MWAADPIETQNAGHGLLVTLVEALLVGCMAKDSGIRLL